MFLIALIQSLSLAQSWAYWYSKGDNDSKCGAYDDSDFEATKQCCACGRGTYSGGGCDTVTVSGSSYNGKMHGTYTKLDFTCDDRPYYKCDDCSSSSDVYIWYDPPEWEWHIGSQGCGKRSMAMRIENRYAMIVTQVGHGRKRRAPGP